MTAVNGETSGDYSPNWPLVLVSKRSDMHQKRNVHDKGIKEGSKTKKHFSGHPLPSIEPKMQAVLKVSVLLVLDSHIVI